MFEILQDLKDNGNKTHLESYDDLKCFDEISEGEGEDDEYEDFIN